MAKSTRLGRKQGYGSRLQRCQGKEFHPLGGALDPVARRILIPARHKKEAKG
jgi:hypothetical protein